MQEPLLFDLETNGFLEAVSVIHCLVIEDTATGDVKKFPPGLIAMGVKWLQEQHSQGRFIGGHNVIKYDIPVIQKLYPGFIVNPALVIDTLVCTRLIWSNIKDTDTGLLKKAVLPGKLFGSHSLEAWGYRLRLMKGEYATEFKARMGDAYVDGMEWLEFSQEMLDYCVQDVVVTSALWKRILGKNYSARALALEHRVAWLMAAQERNGFHFNREKAALLYAKLAQRRGDLERELKEFFKFWHAPAGEVLTKKTRRVFIEDPRGNTERRVKLKGQPAFNQVGWFEKYTEGVRYTKVKIVEFNPSSRDHIADRLTALYGWVPEKFTKGGKPQVDDEVMSKLSYPPCKLLTEYLLVAKRISQLAEGKQAWMLVEKQGRIHGSVNPNGAATGRATHAYPNVAQVPASGSPYGKDCRELFTVPHGWLLVGADASGLELRCLAHFMARYDGGKYVDILLNGDIHWANVQAMGITSEKRDDHNTLHKLYRDGAKTFIYAFLYGAGDEKVGTIVYGMVAKAKALGLDYQHLLDVFFNGQDNPDEEALKAAGKKLKATFLRKTPALKKLVKAVKEAAKRGHLVGLDGRHVHVKSAHAALNYLLQGAGALACKQWLVFLDDELQARGLKHGWDGDYAFCAWVHDEVQIACRNEAIAAIVREAAEACVAKAGEAFNFRCPLAGESKMGLNWAETH